MAKYPCNLNEARTRVCARKDLNCMRLMRRQGGLFQTMGGLPT